VTARAPFAISVSGSGTIKVTLSLCAFVTVRASSAAPKPNKPPVELLATDM
jgi:hypothetical protein